MTAFPTVAAFEAALASLPAPDARAAAAARVRQGQLTKPPGSLGRDHRTRLIGRLPLDLSLPPP